MEGRGSSIGEEGCLLKEGGRRIEVEEMFIEG